MLAGVLVALILAVLPQVTPASLSSDEIKKAIAEGNKGKARLQKVHLDSKWADGVELGLYSTPFSRVAAKATQAKQAYRAFGEADVSKEDVAPELQIYIPSRLLSKRTPLDRANVIAIVFTPKKGTEEEKRAAAIQPIRFTQVTDSVMNAFGAQWDGNGMMAGFPLDLLTRDDVELHVVFDRNVRIAGPSGCTDCRAKLAR